MAERVKAQGNDALKQGKYAEAASLYGQAIGLDPTNAVYYSNRSSALASLSRFDKALADADKCVELRPDWAKAHLRRAGALQGLKKLLRSLLLGLELGVAPLEFSCLGVGRLEVRGQGRNVLLLEPHDFPSHLGLLDGAG